MIYVTIYRAPNINIAWIVQDYFVTNNIDANISVDESNLSDPQRLYSEDKYPCPSFILVPEAAAARAVELLRQFKLV